MPKLTIEKNHSLDTGEVRKRLDTLSNRLSEKYGIDAKWRTPTEATFKRTGASGSIHCTPEKVVVHVDLSFVLGGLRDQIETRIKSELDKALA